MNPSEVPDGLVRVVLDEANDSCVDMGGWEARRLLAAVLPAHERQIRAQVATESAVLAAADLAELLDYVVGRSEVRVARNETLDRAFAALKATLPAEEAR